MKSLEEQIKSTLLPGMYVPEELSLLFSWIEENKLYIERDEYRIGFLYPFDKLKNEWKSEERGGGTHIEFHQEGNINMHLWFGSEDPSVLDRVCIFAKTGGDGSMAGFWIDEEGQQKIVHLGSGSGSTLVCVLAETVIDFIRLLAIGYDEICWNEDFDKTPNEAFVENNMLVHPNMYFQSWVKNTFNVSIPKKANEIVKNASEMGDIESKDKFFQWIEKHTK